jgi:RNA-directed DNA polymerase
MRRESHVRFREGGGVRFPSATRLVILSRQRTQAEEALRRVGELVARLHLELHPDKTRLVNLDRGQEGFTFLGCMIRKRRSIQRNPCLYYVQRWPSPRAMKRLRQRVHELTSARRSGLKDVKALIAVLNPALRGWGAYFRTGNAYAQFHQLDEYVHQRIMRWLWRRGGQRTRFWAARWPQHRLHGMGLHRLSGTVCYPAQATPRRPSVSRVRENRTHGLKGGPAGPSLLR